MNKLFAAELFKLRKDRVFRTLLLILAALAVAYTSLIYWDNLYDGGQQTKGIEFLLESTEMNAYIIKFGVSIFAGFFIASEYSTGVMKTIASSGNGRGGLFAAKLAGFAIGSMTLALVFPAVGTAVDTVLNGFGPIPEGMSSLYVPRMLGLTLLYAAGYSAIVALFATLFAESGKTIGFSTIFFMLIDSILGMLGNYIPFINTVYDYSVFKLLGEIGKPTMTEGILPTVVIVPLLTIAVFGVLGYAAYRRKEIK